MQNRRKSTQRKSSIPSVVKKSKSRQRSQSQTKIKNGINSTKFPPSDQRSSKKFQIKLTEVKQNSKKSSLSKKKRSGRESLDLTYMQNNKRKLDMFSGVPRNEAKKLVRQDSPFDQDEPQRSRSRGSSHYKGTKNTYYSYNNTPTSKFKQPIHALLDNNTDCRETDVQGDSDNEDEYQSKTFTQTKNQNESKYGSTQKIGMTQEYLETQKELAKSKSKIYEYRYKIDALKKRLIDQDRQIQEQKEKFDHEQDKSDEFFTKAEKYKIIAKDFRKEIEKLNSEIDELQYKYEQQQKNNEQILRIKEDNEIRIVNHRHQVQQNLIENLRNIQLVASQIDKNCIMIDPINQLFEQIQELNMQDQYTSRTKEEASISSEDNQPAYYIGEGGDNFKVSHDAIIFNGESLNKDDYQHMNIQQKPYIDYVQTPSVQYYNTQSENNSQNMINPDNLTNNSQYQSYHSQNLQNQASQQQYDVLLKIQQEMIQLREESKKVLEDNQALNEKNLNLAVQLDEQKKRSEQSLLPQYKDAFDQLRKANEQMQNKIEILEQERGHINLSNKVEEDLKSMTGKIQQQNYENQNLREERELFVQQIQNLENFNKNQEKMIKFFQSNQQMSLQRQNQTQPLHIQENFEIQQNLNMPVMRQTSNNSLNNSSSSNNIRSKMTRILDQQTNDDQQLLSELSKSPNSQYFSNRTDSYNQIQAFTLNQNTQSDFNLTQSLLNKSNSRGSKTHQNQQHQPIATESSLYVDTVANDKSDLLVIGDNENLFSLSSTQPENQMRLLSPINYMARHIDFNGSNNHPVHYQLNTGNFKNSTMKDQYDIRSNDNLQNMNTKWQQQSRTAHDQLRVHEIIQTQSQEVTNRDKNSVLNINSNSDLSQTRPPIMNQDMVKYEMDSTDNSNRLRANIHEHSDDSNNLNSDRSLEQHLQILRKNQNHNNSKHLSQETFQQKNANGSIQSQYYISKDQIISNTNISSNRSKYQSQSQNLQQMINKENIMMIEDDLLFNHNSNKNLNSKVKSPAFYDSNNQASVNENFHTGSHQAIFNQQIVLDNLVSRHQNDSYCTTDKQNTLTSGLLSFTNTDGVGMSSSNKNGSVVSNFTSERTLNLKKEINSLDEEIFQLQNSLKQALVKKGSELVDY